jgi:hypothetical protein
MTWRRWLRALQPDPIGSPFDLLEPRRRFAAGGSVPKPPADGDSVPFLLSPGGYQPDYRTDRQREADADRLECALIWSATQANEETTDGRD